MIRAALSSAIFHKVKLLENPRNEGFGRANNRALEKVKTPYALLMNPDAMLKEGALQCLLEAAKRFPDAAIVAPVLYDEQGKPDQSHNAATSFAREKEAW